MKPLHKYVLIGCAGASIVTSSIYASRQIRIGLEHQREAAAQELEQIKERKQNLVAKL